MLTITRLDGRIVTFAFYDYEIINGCATLFHAQVVQEFQLPERTTLLLKDKNYIMRMLYKDWLITYHTFTYIFPCKLDSVLSVILLNFMLCYVVMFALGTTATQQDYTSGRV